jgi:hypothetical protein
LKFFIKLDISFFDDFFKPRLTLFTAKTMGTYLKPFAGFIFLSMLFACKKPYTPAIIASNPQYLVVEGVINSGSDSTNIKLSHTISLATDSTKSTPETGARVIVESSKNDQYNLTETNAGTYVTSNLNLPTDRTYRLHIFTSANAEYVSDFVENMITPPIDSVYGIPVKTGVQFYVSSHANTIGTHYYRWSYDESWRYNIDPAEISEWIYQNNQILPRTMAAEISNICYISPAPSNSIFIGESYLAQGAVNKAALGYVDASTGKLASEYSLLVNQYSLTGDAYTFWNLLKTNSEQLGTVFDAQPSSAISNIHGVNNPHEPVVGYVSVSTVTTKRIFLLERTLPPFAINIPPDVECPSGYIAIAPSATFPLRAQQIFGSGDTVIVNQITIPKNTIIVGYTYAAKNCVDCQTTGGSNVKPPYWLSL